MLLIILMPLIGTAAGSSAVFFMNHRAKALQTAFGGFAAGVMTAASVWSLLIPSVEKSESLGRFAFVPAALGLFLGVFALVAVDYAVVRLCESNKIKSRADMPFVAITIHNIPEGMAVGMMCSAAMKSEAHSALAAAFAFSLAISLQNIPEGAIISLPMHSKGMRKRDAFLYGILSGAVEPIGAVVTVVFISLAEKLLPFLFGFAAGAMLFVVSDELIEKRSCARSLPLSAIFFSAGFTVMMVLDVALG